MYYAAVSSSDSSFCAVESLDIWDKHSPSSAVYIRAAYVGMGGGGGLCAKGSSANQDCVSIIVLRRIFLQ